MAQATETYCRLCAEPTLADQLISADDEVGTHSKVTIKMEWINVNLSKPELPKTICFSCFDLLERTWSFLHTVRSAQTKLASLLTQADVTVVIDDISQNSAGKPVNVDWKDFSGRVKIEKDSVSFNIPDEHLIKREIHDTDVEMNNFDVSSSDSEKPLKEIAKTKQKNKIKRRRKKVEFEMLDVNCISDGKEVKIEIPSNFGLIKMTWEHYTWCCGKCNAQCKSIESLRLHSLEIHNSCCSFKCLDCRKVIINYKTFLSHVRRHYKSLKLNCDLCDRYFDSSALTKKHRRDAHVEAYTNSCSHCGSVYETPELLREHINLYQTSSKKGRKRVETTQTPLECNLCNRKFKNKSNLTTHKSIHKERSRDFSCHVCGKMFFTKGSLSTHMAIHDEVKPYKCEFCTMSFRARGNLNAHITLHSEAKPYICEQCGKSFRVKRHLKSHSIVHTNLMPYVCTVCNKSFRFKTRLNLHVRQHTGAKPYHCVYCKRDFTNGSNYKKHMIRRHNVDTSVRSKMYQPINKMEEVEAVDSKENIILSA